MLRPVASLNAQFHLSTDRSGQIGWRGRAISAGVRSLPFTTRDVGKGIRGNPRVHAEAVIAASAIGLTPMIPNR